MILDVVDSMKAVGLNMTFVEGAIGAGYDASEAVFGDDFMRLKASSLGCDVLEANDNTLLLDLDSTEAVEEFWRRLPLVKSLGFVGEDAVELLVSKSGNTHAVVKLARPLDIVRRVALQSILGSDWRRDVLSLAGIDKGKKFPIVLFRPKVKKP